MISVRDFRPPNHVLCTKCNACISHSNASKLAMLPSQMIPKQPCQCNPSWLLDAKHAILIFSTHSSSVFMPSYAFKWIFLIFISCLSFLKASKLYERCKHMQKMLQETIFPWNHSMLIQSTFPTFQTAPVFFHIYRSEKTGITK